MESETRTNGITLLPCPFCGGEAFVNDDPTGNGGKPYMSGNVGLGRLWSIECDECGADGGFWQDCEIAIAAWNTRTMLGSGTCKNKATSLRTFWCDCCDCALEDWMDVGGKLVNGLRYCPNCGAKVVEQ